MYLTLAPSLACALPSLAIIFRAPTSLDLQFRTNLVGSAAARSWHPTSLNRRLVRIDKPFDVDHSGLGTTGAGALSERYLVEFVQTQPLPTIAPAEYAECSFVLGLLCCHLIHDVPCTVF